MYQTPAGQSASTAESQSSGLSRVSQSFEDAHSTDPEDHVTKLQSQIPPRLEYFVSMSAEVSPEPPSRSRSPKRKRSDSEESDIAQYDGAGDAALQYAYEEDLPSDVEQAFSPDDGPNKKRLKVERPRTLNYALHMTLRGHKRGVAAVKYSPDGRWIASCCK